MPRRVEDIVRNDRRTIREIPIAEEREQARRKPAETESGRPIPIHRLRIPKPEPEFAAKPHRKSGSGGSRWLISIVIVVALVGGAGYVASVYFSRATFKIMPVTLPVSADATIVATATTTPGYVTYKLARFTASASTSVPAVDGPMLSTQATGRVTVYNAYSAQSQRLVAGTRLASDTGLIYRLTGSVTIPGYKTSASGTMTPGFLTVPVTADAPGAEYNLYKNTDPVDFSIVAYKGTPRYGKVYAKAATDIVGGFVGKKKTVNPTILASSTANLRAALTARLLAEAKAAVPDGYIMYDTAYVTAFSAPASSGTAVDSATIAVTGTLHSILFRTADIATKLAGADKVNSFGDFGYTAPGVEDLSFTITNGKDFSPTKANTLIARMKGEMELVGKIPIESLRSKLTGLPLVETRDVLESYSRVINVTESSGELFPSWVTSVPSDMERISVTVLTK